VSPLTLALVALYATGPRTFACEVAGSAGAPVPDSVVAARLVADAAIIVRARAIAIDSASASASSRAPAGARFERIELLKAADSLPPVFTVSPGALVDLDEFNTHSVPYPVVRRSGLAGTCFATTYRRGAEYLLFMNRSADGSVTPYWAPLMPTNEQLRGPMDPWLLWVRAHRR
jgi:hypothetical protein